MSLCTPWTVIAQKFARVGLASITATIYVQLLLHHSNFSKFHEMWNSVRFYQLLFLIFHKVADFGDTYMNYLGGHVLPDSSKVV